MRIESMNQATAAMYQGSTAGSQAVKTPEIENINTGENSTVQKTTEPDELSAAKTGLSDAEETDTEQGTTPERQNAQQEKIESAVEEINRRTNTEAIFGVHDATNRVTIKIVDKDSKEVIKEFPPEQTLDMIAKVWELAGIFVDEKR